MYISHLNLKFSRDTMYDHENNSLRLKSKSH
jgi:hypothetical protein